MRGKCYRETKSIQREKIDTEREKSIQRERKRINKREAVTVVHRLPGFCLFLFKLTDFLCKLSLCKHSE